MLTLRQSADIAAFDVKRRRITCWAQTLRLTCGQAVRGYCRIFAASALAFAFALLFSRESWAALYPVKSLALDFPTGTAYFFCHTGDPGGYPTGGTVPNHGQISITSPTNRSEDCAQGAGTSGSVCKRRTGTTTTATRSSCKSVERPPVEQRGCQRSSMSVSHLRRHRAGDRICIPPVSTRRGFGRSASTVRP
jgi:hypothetical protein